MTDPDKPVKCSECGHICKWEEVIADEVYVENGPYALASICPECFDEATWETVKQEEE